MKQFLIALTMLVSLNSYAADYSACAPETKNCAKPTSCAAYYLCIEQEFQLVNILILKSISALELDQKKICAEKRDELEGEIVGHATTIECVDTINGPQFGG